MRENNVKAKLRAGKVAWGAMCMEFATPGIARLTAAAGAEFIVFDMEHTGWSLETVKMLVSTTFATNLLPIVRVPVLDYHFIAHALDCGAGGIVVPMVPSAEAAQRAASFAYYPPLGVRGCSVGLTHDDYVSGDVVSKLKQANDQLLLILQIESISGLSDVEAIAAMEGVDGLWVGPYDLSCSMGIPGQFDHPQLAAAIERVHRATKEAGKFMVLGTGDPDQLNAGPSHGYSMLIYTSDVNIYQRALRQCFDRTREAWSR